MKIKLPVTVLVQTRNEEPSILRCLSHLDDFDEVVVVDSHSSDRTVELASGAGARVVPFRWNGRYPKKKQWQLENVAVRNDWILFLDADEYPSSDLIEEIRTVCCAASDQSIAACDIPLLYRFSGEFLAHGHTVRKRALIRKDMVAYPEVDDLSSPGMGELEGHYQPLARGRVLRLRQRLVHDDLDPVTTWFGRHNKYSDWEAYLRLKRDQEARVRQLRSRQGKVFARIPGKPFVFFAYSYIFRRGFLDGRAGFEYALALAFYYWQIDLKVRDLKRVEQREGMN